MPWIVVSGRPHYYIYSETSEMDRTEKGWQWDLDGSRRRVYNYGPQNYVGGKYVMTKSNIHKAGGKE